MKRMDQYGMCVGRRTAQVWALLLGVTLLHEVPNALELLGCGTIITVGMRMTHLYWCVFI